MANLNYVVGRVRNSKRKANGKENVQARRYKRGGEIHSIIHMDTVKINDRIKRIFSSSLLV